MINKVFQKLRPLLQSFGFDIVRYKSLPTTLRLHKVDVVIDVGANDGGYGSGLRSSGWTGPIISFEPQPQAFSRLLELTKDDPLWECHQIALGSEPGQLELNIYQMDVLSSFLVKSDPSGLVDKVKVGVRTLDDILAEYIEPTKRIFIKLDTQGFERQILKGCSAPTSRVVGWQLEMSVIPLYEKQMKIEHSIHVMRQRGYVLWKTLQGLRDPSTFQTFEMDGIFFQSEKSE